MTDGGSRLEPFRPEPAASTNGSHRRARHVFRGVGIGFLTGAIVAASLVPRLQWLNLGRVGWWGRPVLAAAAAGAMVGITRRDDRSVGAIGGAIAALLSVWGVYALLRVSVRVLWVERSAVSVVSSDLGRLFLYAVPAGAGASLAAWHARRFVLGVVARALRR